MSLEEGLQEESKDSFIIIPNVVLLLILVSQKHHSYSWSRGRTEYHMKKVLSASFHSKPHGGKQYSRKKISDVYQLLCAFLWWRCQYNPTTRLPEYRKEVWEKLRIDVSVPTLSRIFLSWRWSWKRPDYRQLNKYTTENISYYFTYVMNIISLPCDKLKFADESHFVSKDLYRDYALSPKGQKVQLIRGGKLSTAYTLTILTDLSTTAPRPVSGKLHTGSNTQWDFLNFVMFCLAEGHLCNGDYFIIDNATVHKGEDCFPVLQDLLEAKGVRLIFLPKYSPELNPCELVFAQIKRRLRNYRKTDSLWWEIAKAMAGVTVENVHNYYKKCIHCLGRTSFK